MCNLIEEEGFEAIPQRRNQLIMSETNSTNPEVDYTDIYRGITAENQIDFLNCAVQCGLGERSMINTLLNKDYGPFIRYCFILTDAEIEPTPLLTDNLCDKCGECIKAGPGNAIDENGETDSWRCAVYYNGANGTKNPFMPPDAFAEFDNRIDIIAGEAKVTPETAKKILSKKACLCQSNVKKPLTKPTIHHIIRNGHTVMMYSYARMRRTVLPEQSIC